MLIIEQVAMRTNNMEAQIDTFKKLGHHLWIQDTVEAVHLYTIGPQLGESFKVHLAFNYEFMPNIEFELIQLVAGHTVQLMLDREQRLSHYGYHTKKDQADSGPDSLLSELLSLQSMGLQILQVTQTVKHTNTDRRYRYAFVSGDMTAGVPIKIIQRLLPKGPVTTVENGKEMFACLRQ